MQEAISNTIEIKPYLVKSASNKVMQKDPEEQTASEVIQSIQRGLMDMMQRLMERVERLIIDDITEEPRIPSTTQ